MRTHRFSQQLNPKESSQFSRVVGLLSVAVGGAGVLWHVVSSSSEAAVSTGHFLGFVAAAAALSCFATAVRGLARHRIRSVLFSVLGGAAGAWLMWQ